MSEVLYQITNDSLDTGMRGFPVGYCTTSYVDPYKGLYYVGMPLSELSNRSPEQIIYLLYTGKEGNEQEVRSFSDELHKRAACSQEVIKHIKLLPRTGHPMTIFCSAILICGMIEGTGDYREDCLNLIAKIPELTATVINHHAGWKGGGQSNSDLGYMENFTRMVNPPIDNKTKLGEVFRLFNVLHYDHGGGNLSTFVGKAVASGLEDMYGSICAAMCALAGPRHGRANQEALTFVEKTLQDLGEDTSPQELENYIRKLLNNKELIYGFGHAVLRVEDPRATVLYDIAEKHYANHPLIKIAKLLRTAGAKVLGENPKISDPYPNVDAISGSVLAAAGFPFPEYYTLLFGMSRVVGIAIQIVYERCEARNGKGTPIMRPDYLYKSR